MSVYELDYDEAVILKSSDVFFNGNRITLILTNQNIVHINSAKFFSGDKEAYKFPLLDLKELNGKPNIRIGRSERGKKQLELYFQRHEKAYSFHGSPNEKKWAAEIEKAYKSAIEKKKTEMTGSKKRIGNIFTPVKDTFENAKNTITSKTAKSKNITIKCPECGAELVGQKGDQVVCSYCDSQVTIK